MTAAPVTAMFVEEEHPRQGGKFAPKGGGENSSKTGARPRKGVPAKTTPKRQRRVIPAGALGFDGVRGTGYGVKGGDKRVRSLQEELNRLGLTDSRGRKLRIDGQLGPLTTQAIQAAQLRLGMRPTGIIAPAFIDRLRSTKAMPAAKKTAPRKRVRANFDPMQKRDDHGRWSKIGAVLDAIKDAWGDDVKDHEVFGGPDGESSSHGVLAFHGGNDYSLNLRIPGEDFQDGRDSAQGVMHLSREDLDSLQYDIGKVLDRLREKPDAGGTLDDGERWKFTWDGSDAVLHANIDDDAEAEHVFLSSADLDSLDLAIGNVLARAANEDAPDLAKFQALRPDEHLVRKREFGGSGEWPWGVAKIEGPNGTTLRMGSTAWLDPNGTGNTLKAYTGGEGPAAALLDEQSAQRVADELADLIAYSKQRQKVIQKANAKFEEDDDEDAWQSAVAQYRTEPTPSRPDSFDVDGNYGEQREVETPWGTVAMRGYSDEFGDWHVEIGVRPKGAVQDEDWTLNGYRPYKDWATKGHHVTMADGTEIPHGELEPADAKRLADYLRTAFETSSADKPVKAAQPVVAAELRGIELARPGKWKLASGPMTVTKQHLIDAARYATRKGARPGYVKIGHNDPRFAVGDGEPALGWVHNVRYAEDEHGPKLLGDIHGMPDWLAAAAPTAWPDRSIEGWADFTDEDGERYALVVDGVALLGVTPPGMSSIQSLRDLPKAVGVAASSGVRVVASMASAPVAAEEGAGPMDPAKIREALGLSADAPDDEVGSALSVAAATLTGGDPAPAPVQASLFGEEPKSAPAMPTLPKGVQVIASSKLDELNATIKSLSAFVEQSKRKERDEVIATAVQAGKFTPAQRADFVRMWDEAPDATRSLIEKLTPNSALAVMAAGYAGGIAQEEDELDREIARLSRPEVRNG